MRQRGPKHPIHRDIGSSDICQSVFRSLFKGLRANRYRLDQPGDLEKLLRVMIRFQRGDEGPAIERETARVVRRF